jgi:hypothetical protein
MGHWKIDAQNKLIAVKLIQEKYNVEQVTLLNGLRQGTLMRFSKYGSESPASVKARNFLCI